MSQFPWESQSLSARRASASLDVTNSSSLSLSGGRAIAVARFISLAPSSACLSPASASARLSESSWRLRPALDRLSRELAATPSSAAAHGVLHPPARAADPLRNLTNAGNSCYLDALLAALWASWDAWDGVVAPASSSSSAAPAAAPAQPSARAAAVAAIAAAMRGEMRSDRTLRATVREAVGRMRRGSGVGAAAVEAVRSAMRAKGFAEGSGKREQEDAAEAFCFLVDALGAPFLPMGESLLYGGRGVRGRHGEDERVASERLLWLDLPGDDNFGKGAGSAGRSLDRDASGDAGVFGDMLQAYFYGDRLEGLRRNEKSVEAWKHRRVIPFYTPVASTGEVAAVDDARAFTAMAVPFALKRFDGRGRKCRARVPLPTRLDFSDFVDDAAASPVAGRCALVLKSVVCHLGDRRQSGHYVAYTRDGFGEGGWRRWDDLKGGSVQRFEEGGLGKKERDELERDAYLVFYELVPGNGTADPRDAWYHVGDCDLYALAEDDRSFAEALQRMEFDDFSSNPDCPMQ